MRIRAALAAVLLTLAAAPALAQVEIKAKPPATEPRPEVVPPGLRYETTRPPDADAYPQAPLVEHDPAFIEPFTADLESPTSTGKLGLSGWTSPNTPVGPSQEYREISGWLAAGFSWVWGGPPPARTRAPAR
jgi:hypothetical protein